MAAPAGNQHAAKDRLIRNGYLNVLDEHPDGRMAAVMAVCRPIVLAAYAGDINAAREITDRIDGKASQQVQIDSTLAISIETDRPKLSADQWLMQHGVIDVIPSVINGLSHSETIPVQPRDSLTTPHEAEVTPLSLDGASS